MPIRHIALTALAVALAACASEEPQRAASAVVAIPAEEAATPEFHGASIGRDSLRSRLSTDD